MGARLGKHAFAEQLVAAGVRWVFGNPGTTEQAFLDQLPDHPPLELVLALHEGVAVGAAEGFARASGEVPFVQLHTAPGLGNATGMLSNAALGGTPMVVYVGDMPRPSLLGEPALSGPIARMAAPVARWVHEVRSADEVPQVLRRAFKVARHERGPVVVVVPADVMDEPTDAAVEVPSYVVPAPVPDPDGLVTAAGLLAGASSPAILVADGLATAGAGAIAAVSALADLLGAPILRGYASEVCVAPDEPLDGGTLPLFDPAATTARLAVHDVVLALGTEVLKQAFAGTGAPLPPGTALVHVGLDAWELGKNQGGVLLVGDPGAAAARLRELLATDAPPHWAERRARVAAELAPGGSAVRGPVGAVMAELVAALPPGTVVVDEAVSAQPALAAHLRPGPGEWFRSRGGGLGAGMALPLGVALARPDRPVVAVVGDGSAMYTATALWTAAHHGIPVSWVVLNNRRYRMLEINMQAYLDDATRARQFVGADLGTPKIDFVALAASLGVPGSRVSGAAAVGRAVADAVAAPGPRLVEIVLDGPGGAA